MWHPLGSGIEPASSKMAGGFFTIEPLGKPLFIFKIFFIYLAASAVWLVGSLVVAFKLLVAACGIYFPDQGSNQGPLNLELGVLAAGPPRKSLHLKFNSPLSSVNGTPLYCLDLCSGVSPPRSPPGCPRAHHSLLGAVAEPTAGWFVEWL